MSATAGQKLRQAREARKLTLEQVSQATHIRLHYLQAMEADEFDSLPSATQARGFLRMVSEYLGVEAEPIVGEPLANADQPGPALTASGRTAQPNTTQSGTPNLNEPKFQEANEIFAGIGRQLGYQRELLGLSLDDVERHTHLRQHYLQALESGKLDALPSPVQGRGMLSNYAAFLGMNEEELLLRFAEGLQSRLSIRQAAEPPKQTKASASQPVLPAPVRRYLSAEFLIGGFLILALAGFVLWSSIRVFALRAPQQITATAPSIADVLLASPTPTLTYTPLPPTATPQAMPQLFPTLAIATDEQTGELVAGAGKIQLNISVRQRTWLKVLVDGEVEFEGRVIPGSAYGFAGESQIEILVSSGSAIQIFYNEQDLGAPGLYGETVNQIYTATGILAPTPTITPTLAPTPTGTVAPAPTRTPASLQPTKPALP